jgi:TetR/AcrR family transcriptional repressor of mexJK operon
MNAAGRAQVNTRREAILEAAKAAFLEDGYQLASMDRIAERARTTKRTVYDHFKSKPALFAAVVERGCEAMTAALPAAEALPADPRLGLPTFAAKCVELAAAPATVRLQRLVAAEAERHPQFAARLREALAAGETRLANYLARSVAEGRLKPHDPATAARALVGAMAEATALRGLLGGKPDLRAMATVVELFLRAYAA